MRFKLLRGCHQQRNSQTGELEMFEARDPEKNIVTSEIDLEQRYGSLKFQNIDRYTSGDSDALQRRIAMLEEENARLREMSQPAPVLPDLASMSVQDLRAFAKSHDIDLEPGLKKDEIVNLIQYELQSA